MVYLVWLVVWALDLVFKELGCFKLELLFIMYTEKLQVGTGNQS